MTCDGCVSTIKTKLELENDISKANITLDDSRLELFSDRNYEISELNKILSSVGDYNVSNNSKNEKNIIMSYFSTYKPIFITLGLVLLLTAISFYNTENTMDGFLRFFMGYFFYFFRKYF